MKLVKTFFLAFIALAAVVVCAEVPERAVTRGSNPVFSPDGTRIAFQRLDGDVFKIGVVTVEGGKVDWIEDGPGNAAYPTWTPDGALIYMAGNDTETAYEAWKSGSRSGYGLRLWRDGEKRDLTHGRCRDYTPCVSPDGKTVYFVTTRGVESESASFSKAAATRIAVMDIAQSPHSVISHGDTETRREPQKEKPRIILDSPNGNNSGYVQPAVSPDGTILIWGHLDSFFDSWRICGMRLSNPAPLYPITPSSLAALSPRWHPNGRLICFTGFRKDDPGWGVWVENILTGKVKRLATGENPCFSPDGNSIAYDRDGTVFIRTFGPADEPDEILPDIHDDDAPETVLLAAGGITSETSFDIAGDERFALGDGTTFFVRAKVRLDGSGGVRQFAVGDYAENPQAFQVYLTGGDIWFNTRGFDNKWLAVKCSGGASTPCEPQTQDGSQHYQEISFVAVRTVKRLVISVNGGKPENEIRGPFLSLDTPQRLVVGGALKQGEAIESLEIGTGWPHELPKTPTREDLFK